MKGREDAASRGVKAVANRWPQPAAVARMVCFPHAGGGPSAYRSWAVGLAPDVEVWTATMPGHPGRGSDPFASDWRRLAGEFAEAIAAEVDVPVVLGGHSLGALVAFEVARELTRQGMAPLHLVASGRPAPDTHVCRQVPATDAELLSQVDSLFDGIPRAVRSVPEVLREFVPILRADIELAAMHRHEPGPALACPIMAVGGKDDPFVSLAGLSAWARHTHAGFCVHQVDGGHFYARADEHRVLGLVRDVLGCR